MFARLGLHLIKETCKTVDGSSKGKHKGKQRSSVM